ncbi:hypothetical protein Vafri_9025 [Volvox africanus]|uniref:Polycystin cation channel PKD1/PKD2 domain-containing protein n=1 Tax=Volvox africanus TaxID=51714 RepID=A0A8J4F231_9CHLO|nr:hypothetical protein Vafri_9025 [Volvox africanus]
MADRSRHGPEHPSHLHSAFEDAEAQGSTPAASPIDHNGPGGPGPGAGPGVGVAVTLQNPVSHPSRHHRRRYRHNSQPLSSSGIATATSPGHPSRSRIYAAASSPPPRLPHHRSASTSQPHSLSVSPSPSISPHGSISPSLSFRSHSRSRASPGSIYRLQYGHRALDGAALAAACAAAPINPIITAPASHLSFGPSTHRGLRRADESSGALNNIHPDILGDLRALDDLEGGSLLRPLLTQPPPGGDDGGGGGLGDGGEGRGEGLGEEGGAGGEGGGVHVDEAATYEVPELLEAKPRDVLQFIEEEGVVKLAEFEVADGLALKAFGSEPFLVMGQDHAEPPGLKEMWMERLSEGGKVQGTGWTSTLSVEAHVVNLYDAAAPGNAGLLRPLLARLRVHGCPPTVFALPVVQAVIALKWNTWARHFLFAEFVFYAAWLAAFSAFSLLLEDGAETPDSDDDTAAAAVTAAAPFRFHPAATGSLPVVRMLSSVVQTATAMLGGVDSGEFEPRGWNGGAAAGAASSRSIVDDGGCPARFLNPWDWGALWVLLASPRGFAQLATSTAAVAAMLPFAYMELCTVVVQGLAWLNLFNLADVASYFLAIALWFAHIRCGSLPSSAWFSGALALQHVLLWSKLHYYARVLTPTRGGFNDTIRMVLSELRTFLTFVGLVMMGFAFAFYCLFRQDREEFADFSTLWHSFASMFAYMLQMFDYSVLYNSTHPVLAMILFMAYELMVAVLLLNIMIALMTAAFARVSADEGLRYLIYKAEVIDELESTLPPWLMRSAWFPHFVHVLKVSPRSTYEINLNSVWSGMSTLQSSLMNAQQETRLRVEALEAKVDVIDQKLSATVRLLASRLLTHSELAAALSMDDVAEAASDVSDERDLDRDLDGEDGEPDPEKWRDADLDPRPDEQAVPEAEEEGYDNSGGDGGGGVAAATVAALLRARRVHVSGGGSGSRRGSIKGPFRESSTVAPPYRSGHYTSHPSPRRLQSSHTYTHHSSHHHHHHQPGGHHYSSHASHAASAQLRNQTHGHGHGGYSAHGHGQSHHHGASVVNATRASSQGPSAAASHGPSRDPSVPGPAHLNHARTATTAARLHAFYSHGHGHNHHTHQQQQQQREYVRHPSDAAAMPPYEAPSAAIGRSSGSSGGAMPVTAPPVHERRENYTGTGPSDAGGDSGGVGDAVGAGTVYEGAVVLDMRGVEDHMTRDGAALGHAARPSYNYHRWYSTGGGSGAGGFSGGGDGPGGSGGSGGTTAPVMASIAEHGSPSLAGSDTLTDNSPKRRSEAGGSSTRGAPDA